MRVTSQTKVATEQRILDSAARLFRHSGWESTTTREIATAAGIATGTLFNYFPSKETIAAALIANALESFNEEFLRRAPGESSLEEDLFSLVWGGLKSLREYREFLASVGESIFSPLARPSAERPGDSIRVRHLEAVEQLVGAHGGRTPIPAVTLQLYWALYVGVFASWAADPSPNQEDTLALLDQSLKLIIPTLTQGGDRD